MGLPDDFDLQKFLESIDTSPVLNGVRVVYIPENRPLIVLREGPPSCPVGGGRKAVILRDPIEITALQIPAAAEVRDSKVLREVLGMGLSCSAAVISWIVVGGSAVATPVTGGTSSFVTVLSWTAAGASSVQCVDGVNRVRLELKDPAVLDDLDSQLWYQRTSLAVDAVSVVGGVAAVATTLKMVLALKTSTGKSTKSILQGLSRADRKRVAEDLVRAQNPNISNKQLKLFVRNGIYPKRMMPGEVPYALRLELMDAVAAAFSFTGSAMGGVVKKGLVIGFGNAMDTY